MSDQFVFFWGGPFSQWFKSKFEIGGVTYNCAEQYMMAEKAKMFGDYGALAKIMAINDPKKQKEFGRLVKGFSEFKWFNECIQIVLAGNMAKFSQNEGLLAELEKTIGTLLVEASPYDTIWGIGI